jgi:hypothetical protein
MSVEGDSFLPLLFAVARPERNHLRIQQVARGIFTPSNAIARAAGIAVIDQTLVCASLGIILRSDLCLQP